MHDAAHHHAHDPKTGINRHGLRISLQSAFTFPKNSREYLLAIDAWVGTDRRPVKLVALLDFSRRQVLQVDKVRYEAINSRAVAEYDVSEHAVLVCEDLLQVSGLVQCVARGEHHQAARNLGSIFHCTH